jgi:hypothetical protein
LLGCAPLGGGHRDCRFVQAYRSSVCFPACFISLARQAVGYAPRPACQHWHCHACA